MDLFRRSTRIVFALLLGSTALPSAGIAADVNAEIEALRKKFEAKESEQRSQPTGNSQISRQLKLIQTMIGRGEYEKARQILDNLGGYGLPAEIQDEWLEKADTIGKELEKLQAESMEKWRSEVDSLVADTKRTCLEAKNSADLDPLLVRCAALQMRREQQENVLGQRTYRKLMGVAATLSAWSNYLDFRDAGSTKRANETLRDLRRNESIYPVLTASEIDSRFLTGDLETLTVRAALAKSLEGLKSPDDLPSAIEKIKAYAANPLNPELSSLTNELRRIELLQQAWNAAKANDDATALKALERVNGAGGYEDATIYYEPLKRQISKSVIDRKVQNWTKLTQNEGEEPSAFIDRILVELQGKQDYATMIEVMKFGEQIARPQGGASQTDRSALEKYLAAQRFEKAGDDIAAISNYRSVVASTGKYAPTTQAEEALKKLKERNPEAFKSNEGLVLEEIRGLRQQIQMLMGRMGGRPYPMPGQ